MWFNEPPVYEVFIVTDVLDGNVFGVNEPLCEPTSEPVMVGPPYML